MEHRPNTPHTTLLKLFQFEKEIRHAQKHADLAYLVVNQLRGLLPFDSAVLFSLHHKSPRVEMISDIAIVDRNAPYVTWLTGMIKALIKNGKAAAPGPIDVSALKADSISDDPEWSARPVFWQPLISPIGRQIGGLWLTREHSFRPEELALLDKISEVTAHAWEALDGKRKMPLHKIRLRPLILAACLLLIPVLFIPVPQSVLAPAEVVARHPAMVTAPMDGVIKTVAVASNTPVQIGQVLLSYDATEHQGRLAVAEEELLVAESQLMSARQAAFVDPRVKGQIAVLQSRLNLRRTERDYARQMLDKIDITAARAGVAVFRDKADLEGIPVKAGQRLMLIAAPHDTELKIELPVADAVSFERGSQVRLFLDRAPLAPIDATLTYSSFAAEPPPSHVLSYHLKATFTGSDKPRLGLRGTARISGQDVTLFFYLFRRPLSALRQYLGL
ncbi:efflux RND transporter periplasmic adaptor subunit [Aestuariispira ectoiniformans]|uniref:efflux RND transporter periplasmic adaptor subunit n=1 Tax=Aestuariispira ectoiniformans TaxID=2775080 RepID=UPI00223C3591|nr:biotin/lipoyl-binding protein [Aestuariispira ectoiniformans]